VFYIKLYDKGVEYIKLLSRAERVVGGRALLGRRFGRVKGRRGNGA
jgi:hypothetical protein